MSIDLVLLTNGVSINKVFDKGCQTWPPEIIFEDGLCAKDAHVARGGRGMDGGKEKRVSRKRDVHAIFKV